MGELKYFQLSKTTFDTNLAFCPTFFYCFFFKLFSCCKPKKKKQTRANFQRMIELCENTRQPEWACPKKSSTYCLLAPFDANDFPVFCTANIPLSVFSDRHFLGRGEVLQCLTLRGNKYSTFRSSGSNAVFINFVKLYPVATLFADNAFILRKWWYLSSDIYPPPERDVLLYPGAETRDLWL